MRGGASAGGGSERNPERVSSLAAAGGSRGRALLGCHRAPPHQGALPALPLYQGRRVLRRPGLGGGWGARGAGGTPGGEKHLLRGSRATGQATLSPEPGERVVREDFKLRWRNLDKDRSLFSRGLEFSSRVSPATPCFLWRGNLLPLPSKPARTGTLPGLNKDHL